MDKELKSILDEENSIIDSICELNRRISKAEMKQERMFELWERSDDNRMRPHVELNIAELTVMRKQQQINDQELARIRKRLSDCVRIMLDQKSPVYLPPIKREDITPEQAKDMLVKANEKRRRPKRGGVTRKGGRTYVKTNKVQN